MSKETHEREAAGSRVSAAEGLLRALRAQGIDRCFANLGSDHPPILEAYARLEAAGELDALPELIPVPHEFVALSAAHGYAAATGEPQAVLVHVDVGTQNLGGALHDAHRANAPVFVVAGLAPTTDAGHPGSRDSPIHYVQDVFDQPGIVDEYCRWRTEYRTPTDPGVTVARGLERAQSTPPGPVYVAAAREALEAEVAATTGRAPTPAHPDAAAEGTLDELAARIDAAEAPLVVTTHLGRHPAAESVAALVDFAEAAGAGVVEHSPNVVNFPRDHELHAGYTPAAAFEETDLVLLVASDVPWVPAAGTPDAPVIQIDADASKQEFPHWDFERERVVEADPVGTLSRLAERVDGDPGPWPRIHATQRADWADELAADREAGRFTPAVLSAELRAAVDEETIVVEDVVTSKGALVRQLPRDAPGSMIGKGGSGLGWAPGAAVGVKLANPDRRVVSLTGDGAYLFGHPTVSAWLAVDRDAPTLTVVYNNGGWNAVNGAARASHPDVPGGGDAYPGARFGTDIDLSVPATAVGAHTAVARDVEALREVLPAAAEAVDGGTPAVIDARIERF